LPASWDSAIGASGSGLGVNRSRPLISKREESLE
jgi:hypothetical protein